MIKGKKFVKLQAQAMLNDWTSNDSFEHFTRSKQRQKSCYASFIFIHITFNF